MSSKCRHVKGKLDNGTELFPVVRPSGVIGSAYSSAQNNAIVREGDASSEDG